MLTGIKLPRALKKIIKLPRALKHNYNIHQTTKFYTLVKIERNATKILKEAKFMKFVFETVENIHVVGKGKNVGYKHFLPSQQCF